MDSLTQIVLGAAVGEVCLGKKLGNKAMVWGAIAGTIPDLDVLSNLWMDDLQGLVFHRGVSHSLFFAFVFSFLMAWLAGRWYASRLHLSPSLRRIGFVGTMLAILTLLLVFSLVGFAMGQLLGVAIVIGVFAWPAYSLIKRAWYNFQHPYEMDINISYKEWYVFFLMTIVTHPILDCFTVYGTQLLAPFSDLRVSWDNISVADPIYTVLLGLPLMILSYLNRNDIKRRWWLWAGIVLSSAYMMLTFVNKNKVNKVLEETCAEEGIVYNRYITTPTILNNVLWSATVETDSILYCGKYSFFDRENKFKLQAYPKNHELLHNKDSDHTLQILRWFSKDYYNILLREDGQLQFNDMRYGTMDMATTANNKSEDDFIFKFVLKDSPNGYQLDESKGGPPRGRENDMFVRLWHRIKGI